MNARALDGYLSAVASKPFRLGGFDCVRFVAEALLVGWDRDYLKALGYCDRRSVVHRLRHDGGLAAAIDKILPQRVYTHELIPGDIAFFEEPVATVGLVMQGYTAIKTNGVIHRVDTAVADFGWRT